MKILMVVHQFLPRHVAGSEVYTFRLAQALQRRGHRVHLYFTEIRPDRPQYELTRGNYDGLPYLEVVHNRDFASFRETYRDARMEAHFETVLDEVQPDVVHFQHLHLHSIGYVDVAHRRRLPMLYTLHEFMLVCLNDGLLLRPGPTPCHEAEPGACARCAAVVYGHLTDEPGRFWWSAAVARLRRRLGRMATNAPSDGRAYLDSVKRRRADIEATLRKVGLFVAPSQFLRRRFIDEGLVSPERIVLSDNGFFVDPFLHLARHRSAVLRIGYLGTISEYKGVHLLVEAVRDLPASKYECRIYGDLDVFPRYKARLLGAGTPASLRFMGRLEVEQVPSAIAELDVLVVPSIWPENSPLTIHEAFLANVPVITADFGGMAELVEHGRNGLHFRRGDAFDLRRQLLRLIDEPGLLESLGAQPTEVKTIDEDAIQTEERYQSLLPVPA